MNITKIETYMQKPDLYSEGTAIMWTDEYISKQLLKAHIDGGHDLASRASVKIDCIVSGINRLANNDQLRLLDLGCGPGLYTSRFAKLGYQVTGIDFSQHSIDYARKQAAAEGLTIDYICQNYLEMNYDYAFDIITLIYCDFGALIQRDREILIKKIFKALKPGGMLIFDAYNTDYLATKSFGREWTCSTGGFWREEPYLCLSEAFHYPDHKALLDQHIIVDEEGAFKVYRFWNHYFNIIDSADLFTQCGFSKVEEIHLDSATNPVLEKEVSFYAVIK